MKIKCDKHGEVEAYINKNCDAFCPECYKESLLKFINGLSEDEIESLSKRITSHKSKSMGCVVKEYKCPICNKDWKD